MGKNRVLAGKSLNQHFLRFYKMNLPNDRELWPERYFEAWSERAAIIEYEANFPRWKAEILAEKDIRKQASQEWEPLT